MTIHIRSRWSPHDDAYCGAADPVEEETLTPLADGGVVQRIYGFEVGAWGPDEVCPDCWRAWVGVRGER